MTVSPAIFPVLDWSRRSRSGRGDIKKPALLESMLSAGGSTSFIIVQNGELVFSWGDIARKSSIASVRKSLIGILYGISADEGMIDLDASLGDLGIDDTQSLTHQEKTATIRDLLTTRSGIYHPSVYDTPHGRPARGSHAPGTFWFYNNWDFNVLATILARRTGTDMFDSFAKRIALPLGMQDFDASDFTFLHGPESIHPVYKMRFSARDLARIGLLYLRNGQWAGQKIVPESWVHESTRSHADLGGGRGYGYLWWSAEANAPGDRLHADVPLYYASGMGGQYIIVLPDRDIVVVHRAAQVDHGIDHGRMGDLLTLALAAINP